MQWWKHEKAYEGKYSKPAGKVCWDIGTHSRYKVLPELQEAVWYGLRIVPSEVKQWFLDKYKLENVTLILLLSIEQNIQMEAELNEYFETGVLPS